MQDGAPELSADRRSWLEKHAVPGIIYSNSRTVYGMSKQRPLYLFKPADRSLPEFVVSVKARTQRPWYATVRFHSWDQRAAGSHPRGTIDQLIGEVGASIEQDIRYLLLQNRLPDRDLREVPAAPPEPVSEEARACFDGACAIDPPDCRDHDDAFHCRLGPDDSFELAVHISDPGSVVPAAQTPAYTDRWSTVYLPTPLRAVHMLPRSVAEELGSLSTEGPRPALSLVLRGRGDTIEERVLVRSAVRCREILTYEEADRRLRSAGDQVGDAWAVVNRLQGRRPLVSGLTDSHELIEYLMVLTNVTVAELLTERFPGRVIYRTHQRRALDTEEALALRHTDPELWQYLERREQRAACYTLTPGSHESLQAVSGQLGLYTHFTSPLRRAVDFYLQRLCHCWLSGLDPDAEGLTADALQRICDQSNEFSRRTKKLDRQVRRLQYIYGLHGRDSDVVRATVVEIGGDGRLTLRLPSIGLEERVRPVSEQLSEAIAVEAGPGRWAAENRHTGARCELRLYQPVTVKVVANREQPYRKLQLRVQELAPLLG